MATINTESYEEVPVQVEPAEQASVTTPVIRVILADSQAIYRVGLRKVFVKVKKLHQFPVNCSSNDGKLG